MALLKIRIHFPQSSEEGRETGVGLRTGKGMFAKCTKELTVKWKMRLENVGSNKRVHLCEAYLD